MDEDDRQFGRVIGLLEGGPHMRTLSALMLAAVAMLAHAQEFPSRPLRIIVPLPAGSTTDVVMRATAQELSPRLKQPVVVENKPGGNWVIGAEACREPRRTAIRCA